MFKKLITIVIAFFVLMSVSGIATAKGKITDNVNPFIGTGGHGHTYPGATLPFGMVQLSPDTYNEGWDWCSGYYESDNSIMGFSHTHLTGTGIADYGDILFMPTTGQIKTNPGSRENPSEGYRSRFKHENEKAGPGYYSVKLDDYNIKAELTATERTGYHKYTFPKSDEANIIIDLYHGISDKPLNGNFKVVSDTEIEGYRQSAGWAGNHFVYFVAKFSKPFKSCGIALDDKIIMNEKSGEGKTLKGFVRFSTKKDEAVSVKVGISHVSLDGARKNLEKEAGKLSFEEVRKNAEKIWEKELSRITVEGGTKEQKTIFYTALYHSMICPNLFSDTDGNYKGMDDKKIHNTKNYDTYTLFSLWDTFRALHPLLSIIDHKRTNDFVNTFLAKSQEGGQLPVWEYAGHETNIMIGFHSIPVILDAYMKGIRNYDAEKLFDAMKRQLEQSRVDLKAYNSIGYIPADKMTKSVSRNLEYAYDEWCVAKFAELLGKKDDYEKYSKRALNYVNMFDPSTGFMRGRTSDGEFVSPFTPDKITHDYEEGTAWHYNLFVPHDIKGLINLFGNKENFSKRLNDLFTLTNSEAGSLQDVTGFVGQYAHGNEPSHNMAYLFNFIGQGWRTQETVRTIMDDLYFAKPDGLSGNEDCGQMSAWYVFSAMGFYPVCPGTNEYVIGSPIFSKVTINLENGKKFVINAAKTSHENKYISSVTKNNKPYLLSYIKQEDIQNGSVFTFNMSATPNKNWCTDEASQPYSFTKNLQVSMPYMKSGDNTFLHVSSIFLDCLTGGADIYYTTDGSTPGKSSLKYEKPFSVNETTTLKAIAFRDGFETSPVFTTKLIKAEMANALNVANLGEGLDYSYYEGDFRSAYDLMKIKPVKDGVADFPKLTDAGREENYGLKFEGYVNIPKDGLYKFFTKSDDGSILEIDSKLVVNNDGPHGAAVATGLTALKAGLHSFRLLYYQGSSDAELSVGVVSREGKMENLPKEWFFRFKGK